MRGGKYVGDISTSYLFILASLFSLNDNISHIRGSNFIPVAVLCFLERGLRNKIQFTYILRLFYLYYQVVHYIVTTYIDHVTIYVYVRCQIMCINLCRDSVQTYVFLHRTTRLGVLLFKESAHKIVVVLTYM